MGGGFEGFILIIILGVIGLFTYSFYKIQGKILCSFVRQNKTEIEKFVPIKARHVRFDNGRYYVITDRIILKKYARGIHKLFPTYVPKLDFQWWTPMPRDPANGQYSWHTPEARDAAWSEHNHIAYAKGAEAQAGVKKRLPDWFLPAIAIVLTLAVGFLVYQMSAQVAELQNLIKVGQ